MSTKKLVQVFSPLGINTIGQPTPSGEYQQPTKKEQVDPCLGDADRQRVPPRSLAMSQVSRRGRFFYPFVLHYLFGLSRRLVFSVDVR
jgi:hypothetical protein